MSNYNLPTNPTNQIDPTIKNEFINILLGLYSDEWLAVYQYSIESDFCLMLQSKNKISDIVYSEITKELNKHTEEEFNHAKLLVPELIRMGSGPVSHIDYLSKNANTSFLVPYTNEIITLEQSIKSEQDAINGYTKALGFINQYMPNNIQLKDKFNFILEQEYEHKNDLEKILSELQNN